MQWQCKLNWLKKYPAIAYSPASGGVFYLACVLFSTSQSNRSLLLIDKPYTNWKDVQVDLKHHCQLCYHSKSEAKLDAFMHTLIQQSNKLHRPTTEQQDNRLSSKEQEVLTSIIRCIKFCAWQGTSLWGHRDDSTSDTVNQGNFRALLSLCIQSGYKELSAHLETGAKNAQYNSKTAQNELVVCIKECIQEQIVKDIQNQSEENGVAFYGIQADEVHDTSNVEQFRCCHQIHSKEHSSRKTYRVCRLSGY